MPLALDIVGDVHGQLDALCALGRSLGYDVDGEWTHPEGRRLVFLGDLVDRGPSSFETVELVRKLVQAGRALCLMGNHELNLIEWRYGRVRPKHSNVPTIRDIEERRREWDPLLTFMEGLPLALELDDLRVTHAGWHRRCVAALEPSLQTASPVHPIAEPFRDLVRLNGPYENGRLRGGVPTETFENQWEKPLDILLKGYEVDAPEPYPDNDGRMREKIRVLWWRDEHDEVPKDRRIVFGHYWNMPPVEGRHEAFVPPHPSGHPDLRAWFESLRPYVQPEGRMAVPPELKAVCIDFNGMMRVDGPPTVGAYRYPEAEVAWASGGG